MQADPDGDEQRQHPARVWRTPGPGLPLPEPAAERLEPQVGRRRARHEQRQALIRARQCSGRFEPLVRRIDEEEREQADGEREQRVEAGPAKTRDERKPEQAERHRNHAHVQTDQREEPEGAGPDARRGDRHRDLVLERRAGGRQDLHEVGVAGDPGIRDRDGRATQVPERRASRHAERPERIVNRRPGRW